MARRQMQSLLEVREHLAGDRIECLICGRHYRAVCHHARLAHGISARDYKLRFGLPVTRGVATADARAAWSAAIKATHESGSIAAPTHRGGGHKRPPYTADLRRLDPSMVDRVIEAIRSGKTITEACSTPGLPRWTWVHYTLSRDPVARARFDAAIEALPFSQQARMKRLGARFAAAVARHPGKTALAISKILGVSEEAVRRQINRLAL